MFTGWKWKGAIKTGNEDMRQKFRFILVEPEYEANLGAAARLLMNFGQKRMHLVKPDCHIGFTANMHAKHAKNLLKRARIYKSLKEAVRGCSMVVGTTGVKARNREAVRHPLSIKKFSAHLQEVKKDGEIAILFGREGIGLNEEEIGACDFLITIPANPKYPILNLTHAMGIVLYELCAREKVARHVKKSASKGEFEYLKRLIAESVNGAKNIKNPKKTAMAIKRLVCRAMPDELEVRSLIALLKKTDSEKRA